MSGPIPGVEMSELSLANLDQLADGYVGAALKRELEKAITDLEAYGRDGLVRKVELVIALRQRTTDRTELSVTVVAKLPSVPVRKTITVLEKTGKDVKLFFNAASARNPGQMTFTKFALDPLDPFTKGPTDGQGQGSTAATPGPADRPGPDGC